MAKSGRFASQVKCVAAVEARCPPAEKPMTPTRAVSTPHPAAFARTSSIACCTSRQGQVVVAVGHGVFQHDGGKPARREPLRHLIALMADS